MPETALETTPVMKTATIDTMRGPLACIDWMPGAEVKDTVIAAHGLTRQKRDFDFIAGALALNGYRVVAVDAPGRGDSVRLDADDYRLDVYAQMFGEALDALGLDSAHWLGTSMGGLLAFEMAAAGMAERFKSVMLVDITHKPNPEDCKRIAGFMMDEHPVFPSVESYIELLKQYLPLGPVGDDVWRHYAEHQLVETDGGHTFHFDVAITPQAKIAMTEGLDFTEGLRALDCPVGLVAGEISELCRAVEIEELKAEKPGLALRVCAGTGHVPAMADVETQDFIRRFYDSV